MPVYAVGVVTLHTLLAWSLARDDTQTIKLGSAQLEIVTMWAFFRLSSNEVAATVDAW